MSYYWSDYVSAPNGNRKEFDRVMDGALWELRGEEPTSENMKIAIKEIFTNYRQHAYQMDPTKSIYLHIGIDVRSVTATIIALGKAWRPNGWVETSKEVAQRELFRLAEECAMSGRGTLMVVMTTDGYRYDMNGNACILHWRRRVGR